MHEQTQRSLTRDEREALEVFPSSSGDCKKEAIGIERQMHRDSVRRVFVAGKTRNERSERLKALAAIGYRDPEVTQIRQVMDIGRNDPCPCGSGKKFKRCCISVAV